MKIPFFFRVCFLSLFCSILFINNSIAQLTIDAGTKWISDTNTYVLLDALGMRYYTDADTLSNVFRFSGDNDVYIEGSTVPNFRKLMVDKVSHQLLLNTDINVLKRVRFQSGLFNLNSYVVTLSPDALIENENEVSRFTDTNYGSVKISVNVTTPASLNPGNIGAVISSANYSGNVTIIRSHHPQAINSTSYNTISRYYNIYLEDKAGTDATLRLYYFDAEKNGLDESKFVIWKPEEGPWDNLGVSSRNTTLNYVEQTSINRFSGFAIAPYDLVLPVHGLQLSGIWKNDASALTWTTLTETNNRHFELERKYPEENNFTRIAMVASKYADGNSSSPILYQYNDATVKANAATVLYRLKQVDNNGQSFYSNTIVVLPSAIKEFIHKVYPTIVTGNTLFIQAGNMNLQTMQVQIFDIGGKRLFNQSLPYQSQLVNLPIIASGSYRMLIQSDSYTFKCMFIK